ncbi:hypothetical protein E2493_19495 [Sphingomonas parva]|uniref:DUF1269 domain-containing protein n=1 Tax=Sphingomonas parva TaxID=2555898 RepID=A0A4Y8ZKP5_9SPHN|nr:hypothetical protein [Sphingomonas parva]TFI56590.1 hypothetical protein E2493_19495 [Sphingomonas parva]
MNQSIVSAVFDNRLEAERAVEDLRRAGVRDSALSIIGQHEGKTTTTDGAGEHHGDGTGGLVKGALGGAGVGALLGIAALAIPGVGPLAAAGAIAASAVPEGAAVGAALGATAGGLSGLLSRHGVSDEDAHYYESRINQGGTFVSVDARDAGIDAEMAREILYRHGGHNASRARTTATL